MKKFLLAGVGLLLNIAAIGQAVPVITVQPTNQTALVGTAAAFSMAVSGVGPLILQWRLNGVNVPARIITVAGNGVASYSGDGGPATNACLFCPSGVALDGFGNLLIADSVNNRIRRVDTNGIITTIAGNGTGDYYGDGGAATNAAMISPYSLAVDASDNLYIADTGNNVIRRVGNKGIINTVAGNGTTGFGGFSGDGGDATNASLDSPFGVAADSAGSLFIADTENQRVRKVGADGIITTVAGGGSGGDGGLAINASLNNPIGATVDGGGNLFIADTYDNRIRRVGADGKITTVAGDGLPGSSGDDGSATNGSLGFPFGAAFDRFGKLLIADTRNSIIRQVDTNGIITTVAGNRKQGYRGDDAGAVDAELDLPAGVAGDPAGNIYIADTYNHRVREVLAEGPVLALDNLTASMAGGYDVVVTGPDGSVTSSVATLTVLLPPVLIPPSIVPQPSSLPAVAGTQPDINVSATGTPPLSYQWYFDSVAVAGQTNSALELTMEPVDAGDYQVVITNLYGSATSDIVSLEVVLAPSVTLDSTNETVLIGGNARLTASVSGTGAFSYQWRFNGTNLPGIITVAGDGVNNDSGDGGPATNASFPQPFGVATGGAGTFFIADSYGSRIRRVAANGIITTFAGTGLPGYSGDGGPATNAMLARPFGVVVDQSGDLLVADTANNRIRRIDTNGIITTFAGNGVNGFSGDGGPATNAAMSSPGGLAVDASGSLFIAETNGNRIRKVDPSGIITTIAGNGSYGDSGDGGPATHAALRFPIGVAVDGSGNLFFADNGNWRIRRVDTNGIITTVAGNGNFSFSGDGGFATNATLAQPYGVALDPAGNIFIGDAHNNRIRRVDTRGFITTIAGTGAIGYAGDGGAPLSAVLAHPTALAFDSAGNLLFTDSYSEHVREIIAQGPTLTVSNVNAGNAGNYDVVVTSAFGSVTSAIVSLRVVLPALQPALDGNSRTLRLAGPPRQSYVLQAASSLNAPVNWQPIFTNSADTSGVWTFTTAGSPNSSMIFYRVTTP